jgi:hypothetical protein
MSTDLGSPAISRPWSADRAALRKWLLIYLASWLGGAAVLIAGLVTEQSTVTGIGLSVFFLSLVPYIVSLVFSYRVQDKLNKSGLYKPGAWQIVVGGLVLNPLVLGFAIPTSVFFKVRQIDGDIDRGFLRMAPASPPPVQPA